ncbi:hypothetical protein GALL_378570 [mine drainage metagenome]|uniref:Uncharacterized protein n=1 Tax=mine drainage metagenome TaxID=410659 RepID=A0A1J5QWW6_9ZZZZ
MAAAMPMPTAQRPSRTWPGLGTRRSQPKCWAPSVMQRASWRTENGLPVSGSRSGSLISRSTLSPASRAASLVAWRCASSKYAGTVITAPTGSSPSVASARSRSSRRMSAATSIGVFAPCAVRSATMPGRGSIAYGRAAVSMSAALRPISRLADTMVLCGSSMRAASASQPTWRAPAAR